MNTQNPNQIVLVRGVVSHAASCGAFRLAAHHGRWLLATRFRCVEAEDAEELAADIAAERVQDANVVLFPNGTGILRYSTSSGAHSCACAAEEMTLEMPPPGTSPSRSPSKAEAHDHQYRPAPRETLPPPLKDEAEEPGEEDDDEPAPKKDHSDPDFGPEM